MNELALLCREAAALRVRGLPYLLATVVRVTGSSYRRPGARMLVAGDRWIAGSISGGCLERDVLARGAWRTRNGPALVTYDALADDDRGSGCMGIVDVLLERVDDRRDFDPLAYVADRFGAEEEVQLVAVFRSSDPAVRLGTRPDVVTRPGVTAFVERSAPPAHLFVVGTQHDAVALVALAKTIGLEVTVVDASADHATRARFDRLLVASPETAAAEIDRRARAAVVVMTHDLARDQAYLRAVLSTRARYIGLLGARARCARVLGDTSDPRVRAPVGLDIGAEGPRAIALAILAEVHAVLSERGAGAHLEAAE